MAHHLTREQLYQEVWAEPTTKVAAKYGLSDRGLAKLCARHDIPVPPRGYWAKKAHGHKARQSPLPPLTNPHYARITISHQAPKPIEATKPEEPPEILFERDPANLIVVNPTSHLSHPLVRDAAAELRSRTPDLDGIVRTPRGCVDIRVSKPAIGRALRIFQALIRALEERGYPIAIKDGRTEVTVLGEPVTIHMRERLKRVIRDLTPEEHQRRRQGSEVNPYVTHPTGELGFYLERGCVSKDSPKAPLEERLNQFIEALLRDAYRQKTWRAERERAEEERREAEKRRREREKRQQEELARMERFDKLAGWWRKNEERRAFLARLREAIGPVEAFAGWLEWAEDYIRRSDPLERFRKRGETLKVYASVPSYKVEEIRRNGFEDPDHTYSGEKTPPGVKLTDQPQASYTVLEMELPEDFLLPYEVTEPGWMPRTFYVPARVLNSVPKRL